MDFFRRRFIWAVCLSLLTAAPLLAAPIPNQLRPIQVLNRLAFGPRPGDIERVGEVGVDRYIQEQLHPDSIALPAALQARTDSLNTLRMTPVGLFLEYRPPMPGSKTDPEAAKAARQRARIVIEQAAQARLDRAIASPRQLYEVMVDFWFNHFNVFAAKGLDTLWTGSFENDAIRPYAMGRFRDLLGATARHPAMLFYLDNWLNTGPESPGSRGKFDGLNENYARELMELHTLGVDGGYTQRDVTELARIFTGWGLAKAGQARRNQGRNRFGFAAWFRRPAPPDENSIRTGFYFDPSRHDFGDKVFLGHVIKGSGIREGEEALDILAGNPATARHISYQLAQYFVADKPPEHLVQLLAARYQASGGDIREVLNALFHSPEFWDQKYYANRFKTPYQFVVSSVRATGFAPENLRPLLGEMAQLGMPLYGCQTPDGYKFTQSAWLNPDAMLRRLSFATALGTGHLPLMQPPPDLTAHSEPITPVAMGQAPSPQVTLRRIQMDPPDPYKLAQTLGNRFSHSTAAAVREAPPQLRAALVLGSPEFMLR